MRKGLIFGVPFVLWLRQESNLDLELRKLLYYPLYYEAQPVFEVGKDIVFASEF